jgi:hypothetical protein
MDEDTIQMLQDVLQIRHPEVYAVCMEHFNRLVLLSTEVYRLVGYGESKNKAYYILRGKCGQIWCDAFWHLISLNCLRGEGGIIGVTGESTDDYRRLEGYLNAMGAGPAERMYVDIRPDQDEVTVLGQKGRFP